MIKEREFEDQFKHVWGKSATGISIATITVGSPKLATTLINDLFSKSIVADAHNFSKVKKVYKGKLAGNSISHMIREEVNRIVLTTSDDRVAELIEECIKVTG